ncbi:DUF4003 family protein [Exiguobacterium antarcticum]|uniref:DUF4003 family protein n=1 Tax=Exiguobacterium antarcticum TaxID=132920 RepID=A0ABT6R3D1_9BACL|nr:DUF4003 family protein [Exiguobacterium antarcticum]MDI3234794.1 DUF4003 family protein [Exiguobacterium antarcticum]
MYGLFCENYNESYSTLHGESSHDFHRFFALSYTIHDRAFHKGAYDQMMQIVKRKTTRFSALRSRYTPLLISHIELNSTEPDRLLEKVIEAERHIKRRFIKEKAVRPFFALSEVLNREQGIDAFALVEQLKQTHPVLNLAKQYVVTSTLMETKALPESFLETVEQAEKWLEQWMSPSSERLMTAQILGALPELDARKKRIRIWCEMLEEREVRIWDRLFPLLALLETTERVDMIYVTRIVDRERSRNRFSDEVNWLIAFHLLLAKSGKSRLQSALLILATLELTKKPQ